MMQQLIGEHYPKTSCGCSECPHYPEPQFWPNREIADTASNNIGLKDCDQLRDIPHCNSVSTVGMEKLPRAPCNEDVYEILNPDFGMKKAPGFFNIRDNAECSCPNPDTTVTALMDARLNNPMYGGQLQQLDTSPYTGNVRLKDIYNDEYTNYGQGYTNYKTVRGGQIMYYIDKELEPAYHLPVSTIRSRVNVEVLETPMGSIWPQYPKTPLTKDNRYISKQQFTRDVVSHREDMMAHQMAVFNRRKFPIG